MAFSLEQIDTYINALLVNAAALIRESQILYDHEAYARAFSLAHLAREEIAKTLMLHATGVRILAGHTIDFKKLKRRLRDHKQKLIAETINNVVFCAGIDLDIAESLLQVSSRVPDFRNDQKNSSLYVGFENGLVSQPLESVSANRALRTITLAADALKNQMAILKISGPFATREPINIPEISPEDIKFDSKTLQILGEVYATALSKSQAQENTDPAEKS